MGADVIQQLYVPAAFDGNAAFAEGVGKAQIEAGVVDKADRLWAICLNPIYNGVAQRRKKRNVFEHLHKPHDGEPREVEQQLRSRGLKRAPAESAHFQVGIFFARFKHHSRGLFVARMLARKNEDIAPPLLRGVECELAHFQNVAHLFFMSS